MAKVVRDGILTHFKMKNPKKQKIIVAKTAGFCMGVKRAVDMITEVLKKKEGKVYTYGPLIHNLQVTELLSEKGVIIIDNNRIPKEGTVVIRAHGISPRIQRQLEATRISFCDATCPFVVKVQRIISDYARKGYIIIIIGDKGHAEVESYLGYAEGKGVVVDTVNKLDSIPDGYKYCVVAQTTQDVQKFGEIVLALKGRFKAKLKVHNTICNATSRRQEEAVRLSGNVDAMIVVGGMNSANTLRLVSKCQATGTPTYFVERPTELSLGEISKYPTIGITAGASTPQKVIKEVVRYIQCKCKR